MRKRAHLRGHVGPLARAASGGPDLRINRCFFIGSAARPYVHLACQQYFTSISHWMKNARGPVCRAFRIFQSVPAHSYRHLIRCMQAAASTPIFVVAVSSLSLSFFFFVLSVGQNYHRNRRVYEYNPDCAIITSRRAFLSLSLSLFFPPERE